MQKPKVEDGSVSQTIDLYELTGLDLTDYRGLKESIGQAVIDRIVSRTKDNRSLTGGMLKSPYSKAYQKSLNFRAAGKSATDVNMTLTGDMLGTLQVEARDEGLTVMVDPDHARKAYNHIVGDTVPKRNWFGVTKREMTDLLADFEDDLQAVRDAQAQADDVPDKLNALDLLNQREDDQGDD